WWVRTRCPSPRSPARAQTRARARGRAPARGRPAEEAAGIAAAAVGTAAAEVALPTDPKRKRRAQSSRARRPIQWDASCPARKHGARGAERAERGPASKNRARRQTPSAGRVSCYSVAVIAAGSRKL